MSRLPGARRALRWSAGPVVEICQQPDEELAPVTSETGSCASAGWRLQLANRKIAEEVGYDSQVAFRKAFKREVGVRAASYRDLA
jgi:hypothetical protein